MVVSPRYAEYEDTLDTGTCVPVLLPPATSPHNMSADSFPPGDSSSSLTGSQGGADAPSMPSKDSAAHVSEVQPFRQDVSTAPGSSNPELDSAEHKHKHKQQQQQQQQRRQDSAQYYLCKRSGVDHVFVDHPLYCRTSDIYGSSNVNTYQEAGDFPDLDLRYSILCQAALAAPLLLWQNPAHAQPQHRHAEQPSIVEGEAPEEAMLSMPQLHSRLPEALHLEPAGDRSAAMSAPAHAAGGSPESASASAAGPHTGETSAPSTSAAAASVQASPLHLQEHHLAAPAQAPAMKSILSSTNLCYRNRASQQADALRLTACCVLQGGRSGGEQGQTGHPGIDRAPIVFVSNDWPCAPLALRLRHTLQCARTAVDDSSASLGRPAQEGEADRDVSPGQTYAKMELIMPGTLVLHDLTAAENVCLAICS